MNNNNQINRIGDSGKDSLDSVSTPSRNNATHHSNHTPTTPTTTTAAADGEMMNSTTTLPVNATTTTMTTALEDNDDTINDDNTNSTATTRFPLLLRHNPISTVNDSNNNNNDHSNRNEDDNATTTITNGGGGGGVLDRWQPQPDWSIAPGHNDPQSQSQHSNKDPILTSQQCYDGLVIFFQDVFHDGPYNDDDNDDDDVTTTSLQQPSSSSPPLKSSNFHYSPFTLAVATESSSHLAGLEAVYGQPWIYGGSGLGNMDECPTTTAGSTPMMHVCLAGGTGRDSLTFASVCVVSDCTAHDLLAEDFVERLQTASSHVVANDNHVEREQILQDYITLHRRVAQVGKFLGTGWVCGEYKVDWDVLPTTIFCLVVVVCVIFSIIGTFWIPKYVQKARIRNQQQRQQLLNDDSKKEIVDRQTKLSTTTAEYDSTEPSSGSSSERSLPTMMVVNDNPTYAVTSTDDDNDDATENNPSLFSTVLMERLILGNYSTTGKTVGTLSMTTTAPMRTITADSNNNKNSNTSIKIPPFWSAWNISDHLRRLVAQRTDTACLDGLKVGSILWIIAAHVMAIQSSTGAGYLNPKDFLPPNGITTTFIGQLLFSSRFAVDTFLCISGYLAMYVLQKKLTSSRSTTLSTIRRIGGVLIMRILRILPLYGFCLGFWMYIAPHLGSGPFWYQWENFLEPCRKSWWTNLLFVNNFLPWGVSTTASCFYHSWYLAVDVQLFFLFSPWLVLLFQRSFNLAIRVTLFLWISSVVVTAVLTYTQMWSINTFDGAQVALFDVEGYAKPHVRAQSYLTGILVAMWPRRHRRRCRRNWSPYTTGNQQSSSSWSKISFYFRSNNDDTWITVLCLCCLTFLSFVTVTGAYSRRACTFEEMPAYNDCGSLWDPTATFLYTAFSRALWSICVALLMHLCLEDSATATAIEEQKEKDDYDENHDVVVSSPTENETPRDPSSSTTTTTSTTTRRGYITRIVKNILSWNIWTPLAHLSFGAYLIHPIVIFVWKLGGREKVTFRLSSYVMDCCSISVVTFVLALGAALIVEFPAQRLLQLFIITRKKSTAHVSTKQPTTTMVMDVEGNDLRNMSGEMVSTEEETVTLLQSVDDKYGSMSCKQRV